MTSAAPLPQTQVRMAMVISALMMAHQVAGKAARDGIFLSQFDTSSLPTMVASAALVAVISSVVRGRTLVRVGPLRITAISFAASGIAVVMGSDKRARSIDVRAAHVAVIANRVSLLLSVPERAQKPPRPGSAD